MKLQPLTFPYPSGQLFKHVDGGYYEYLFNVYSSADQSEKIVYRHIWPFDVSSWERPLGEFLEKFMPITKETLDMSMSQERVHVQESIALAKAERRKATEKQTA